MNKNYFKNKKITVFGLGLLGGGIGVVKFLAKHGAKKIIVTDIKNKDELKASVARLKGLKNIEFVLGYHRIDDFTKVDMVIKNPQIPWDNKYIKQALAKKIPVEMDSSLFFKLCKNKIIGVTGTKGKTTASSMIFDILENAGEHPVMVGVGKTSVLDKLEELKKDSIVVFELSSWRLSALGESKISPHIGVFTNFFPDHLNYYDSMESYLADKKNIFLNQKHKDWMIINNDDEEVKKLSPEMKSQIIEFSFEEKTSGRTVFIKDENVYLNDGIDAKKVASQKDLGLYRKHNLYNIMAAVGATFACGVTLEKMKKAILKTNMINHRMEFVDEVDGIKYYNDSAATVPQAAIAAVESFKEPVILIAGGSDKKLDFADFGKVISEKVKGVVFLKGEATDKLITEIKKHIPDRDHEKFEIMDSMRKAVEFATRSADKGDAILLSPGAASFGLFSNEFDRGDRFKQNVRKLK